KLTSKKTMLLTVLALALVLCFSFGVSATEYPVSYIQGASNATSGAVDVTVTVEGVSIPYTEVPVSLNAKTSGNQTVADALAAINDAGGLVYFFEEVDVKDASGNVVGTEQNLIDSTSTYFTHVTWFSDDYETYYNETGNGTGYSGWVFRINGGFPMISSGWGASIADATIVDGDVISVYLDNPIAETSSAKFSRVNGVSYANGVVTANVKESHQYFQGANYEWIITAFSSFNGISVQVLDSNGNVKGTATSANGSVSINTGALAAGTYTVKVIGTNSGGNITATSSTATFTVQ
ncbi:MAG: hypothetical protein ACI4PP_03855, partial [Clostridia bacterium]